MSRLTIHPTYRYPNGLQEGPPSGVDGGRTAWRLAGRWLWRAGLAGLALVLVTALAWVLANGSDVDPAPRPAELALPQPTLAPERNIAFALMGLRAAAGLDPAKVGRGLWDVNLRLAQTLAAGTGGPSGADGLSVAANQAASAAAERESQALLGTPLAAAAGDMLGCDEENTDCVALYGAKPDVLAQQRQAMAALGARCDALFDGASSDKGLAFEEPLPTAWHAATAGFPGLPVVRDCGRWLRTGAVLMLRQGRRDEALRLLARDNQLLRALLGGSHSLVAQTVAHRFTRRSITVLAGLAAQDPALVPGVLPLLAPFGKPEQLARRALVVESAVSHGMVGLLGAEQAPAAGAVERADGPWWQRGVGWLGAWADRHHLTLQPERTRQAMDAQWVATVRAIDAGLPAAHHTLKNALGERPGGWLATAARYWRNPAGRMAVDISGGAYAQYLPAFMDLELHREALVLALNAQRLQIAAAGRAVWALQQPMTEQLRERLNWSADGRTLQVRSWASDDKPAQAPQAIRIPLDR